MALISSLPPWAQDARGPGHVDTWPLGDPASRTDAGAEQWSAPQRGVRLRVSWVTADAAVSGEDASLSLDEK